MNTSKQISREQFYAVVSATELKGIFLRHTSAECSFFPTSIKPANTHIDINKTIKWQLSESGDGLFAFVQLDVVGSAIADAAECKKGDRFFQVSVQMCAVYTLSVEGLPHESLAYFAENNGLFNTYPFQREIVHDLTSKMGLPGVLLPLLKPADALTPENSAKEVSG